MNLQFCHDGAGHARSEALRNGALDLGPSRTLQKDVELGVLQIVDVALKAISPAMNDPGNLGGTDHRLSWSVN
jgi:uncharacterized membrane protein